jgi:hypothetical protein
MGSALQLNRWIRMTHLNLSNIQKTNIGESGGATLVQSASIMACNIRAYSRPLAIQ